MSNLSTLPKGDSAWLLRRAIERIMQQVSVLETNIGSSTTGNSLDGQIIFNDNGTLRGDTGLTYAKSTTTLRAGLLIVPGNTQLATVGILYVGTTANPKLKVDVGADLTTITNATITGDLTVATNRLIVNSVGVSTGGSPAGNFGFTTVGKTGGIFANKNAAAQYLAFEMKNSTADYSLYIDQDGVGSNSWSLFDATNSHTALRYYPGASGFWNLHINGLVALTLNATSNLVLKGGTVGATGIGVTFPAAQIASSDANCLDDYEEGAWTPTSTTGTNLTSIVHLLAKYTKVGRVVTLSGYFSATVTTGSTLTYATLAGLPFAVTLAQAGSAYEDVTLKVGFSQANLGDLNVFFAAGTALASGPKTFTYTITYQV